MSSDPPRETQLFCKKNYSLTVVTYIYVCCVWLLKQSEVLNVIAMFVASYQFIAIFTFQIYQKKKKKKLCHYSLILTAVFTLIVSDAAYL